MASRRSEPLLAVALALALGWPAFARATEAAEPATDNVRVGVEASDVRIGEREATWRTQRIQWERRFPGRGGLHVGAEQRQRDAASDQLLVAGGFRLWDRWVLSGQVEHGFDAQFSPRQAAEVALGYRLRRDLVFRLGTRQAKYPESTARIGSASALYYPRDGEWELGYHHGTTGSPRQRIAFALARGQWACGARVTCGVRLASGENVFGADEIGFDTDSGWIAGVHAEYQFASGHGLRLDLGSGRADRFRQDTIALTWRHALGR